VAAPATSGRDKWDFWTVVAVLVALVIIVVILVVAFHKRPAVIATVLGILVPVLAAVFGYAGGNTAGKRTGRQEVRAAVTPQLKQIRAQATEVAVPLAPHTQPVADSENVNLLPNFTPHLTLKSDPANLAQDLDGVLNTLDAM
jgi:hypothetical protein